MILKLTVKQRLGLEFTLSMQRDRPVGELRVLFSLLEKIRTTKAYKETYLRDLPQGGMEWHEDALLAASPFEIEIESEELVKLEELLDAQRGYRGFSVNDMAWVLPLQKLVHEMAGESPASKTGKKK